MFLAIFINESLYSEALPTKVFILSINSINLSAGSSELAIVLPLIADDDFILDTPLDILSNSPVALSPFSLLKRFTYIYLLYAISRSVMYIVTSFGLVYLVKEFGYIGIMGVVVPTLILYRWGLWHFEKLEKMA